MECNKEEALRAKEIAEKKMESRDFLGARKFALKAQQLYPDIENIVQLLVVCDVHCSAEQKLFGTEMDWYGILQLEQTASDLMIKKQYRKFALQLHPDKNKFAGAEAAFKLIGEAQMVLLDREKRSALDMKRRVPMNKTSRHNPMNYSSTMKTNFKTNFTDSNTPQQQQQQQQPTKPVQQQQTGGRPTFWTVCPFCTVKYQYYREVLNKSLRCQHCSRLFVAYQVDRQGTSQATSSSQQAFGQQKDSINHGASKTGVGSQSNLHAEKSNTGLHKKKVPADVSRKPNGKRKRKQVAESSESSDSTGSSNSEGNVVAGEDGFPDVKNHSSFREEHPRRSTCQKHQVSNEENVSNNDYETTKLNSPNGFTGDMKNGHKEVKQKQHSCSEESLLNKNEETSKATNHPNVYVYPEAQFSNFDKYKTKECFGAGQIWAIYDTTDGMPRFYALISKVLSPGFKLQITWFEPHPNDNDEIQWLNNDLPVACGKFKLGDTDITDDDLMFSHLVLCEKIGRNTFTVYPRKGETWALYKNWDIKWYMDVESHRQYEYEFVEILSGYVEGEGVYVSYLSKLKGFVSLFFRNVEKDDRSFQIPPPELFRFSHRVPSFKMSGQEGTGVLIGSYELDPAALPMNLEETALPGNFDVKFFHSSSGDENVRSLDGSKPMGTSEGDVAIHNVNLERSNLAVNKKDSVDDCVPLVSTQEAIKIPDTQFFDFEAGRSPGNFQTGQIWAFYSDEDELPKYYGQISKIETSPVFKLHVSWLTCCWLPENTIEWEDDDMLDSCGRFKVNKTREFQIVYNDTTSVSHIVHADVNGKKRNYDIFPKKGEIWALYRNWSNKIKGSELKNWEHDIVEVLEETDLLIEVLELESVSGHSSVFRGKSNEGSAVNLRIPRTELLRFSHRIPAFKLTEEHGNLRGFWEIDPAALPVHYHRAQDERS